MFRIHLTKALLVMLALVLCTGYLHAATFVSNPTSLSLTCDTVSGPVSGTLGITLVTGTTSYNVTASSSSAAVSVVGTATQAVNSTTVAKTFTFSMASGCANATNGQTVTLSFAATSATTLTVTATLHITSPPVALSAGSSTSINLYCDTQLGPTPATIGLVLPAAGPAVSVTPSATLVSNGNPATFVSMSPGTATSVSSNVTATNFTFTLPAGCKNTTNSQQVALKFTPASGSAITVTATEVITSSKSALAPSPSSVTLTCTGSGSSFTGSSQTVKVYSGANGGTPFTIATPPSAVTLSSTSGGTANATPISFDVSVTSNQCKSLPVGTSSYSLHLVNTPAPDQLLPVTVQVGASTTLQASPTSVSLNYTVTPGGVGTLNSSSVNVSTSSGTAYFLVDPNTVPLWLNVTPSSGSATTSNTQVSFRVTAGAATLSIGVYNATVHFKVSGAIDLPVSVTLHVQNPAAQLSAVEGTARTLYWTLGTALPTLTITPVSSDSPIAYTVSKSGQLNPSVTPNQGIAYNFGSTPIAVTFDPSVFQSFAPGASPLTGTVTLVPANGGSSVPIGITVYAVAPGGGSASLTSASPSTLPTATSGTYTVVLSGSGFITSGGSAAPTQVGVVSNGNFLLDPNIAATVLNSTSIVLQITVPPNDPNLPFSTGGSVILGVCNPQGSNCSTATGAVTLTIGANPIIQGVTSASSYLQAPAPTLTPLAPYDVISIFGQNFCMSGGTGCTGQNTILYGQIDPLTLRYVNTLSPDSSTAGVQQRNLTVTFQTHGANPTPIATAPLLFATNNQINVLVPSAVAGSPSYVGQTVDVIVSFGTSSNTLSSTPYSITIAGTDPGMFTTGGDGQGDAAALAADYSLIGSSNPANARASSSNSDTINLYVTGLGIPDSDGSGACMAVDDYWANVNTQTSASPALTSADGLVMNSAWYTAGSNSLPPCFQTANPTVKIGGVSAHVNWAGWAPSSVAGLYQIQVQLPASSASYKDASGNSATLTGAGIALPIVVTTNSGAVVSQDGVDLYVAKALTPTSPGTIAGSVAAGHLTGTPTLTWDGTAPYTYTYSGKLPGNVSISIDGSTGAITATPTTTGTASIVVNATDANGVKGAVTLSFNIGS